MMPVPGTDIATAIKSARLSFERVSKSNKPVGIVHVHDCLRITT